jgi:hypothetical protein
LSVVTCETPIQFAWMVNALIQKAESHAPAQNLHHPD